MEFSSNAELKHAVIAVWGRTAVCGSREKTRTPRGFYLTAEVDNDDTFVAPTEWAIRTQWALVGDVSTSSEGMVEGHSLHPGRGRRGRQHFKG